MTRKWKFIFASLFITGWIFLFNNTAWAEDTVAQVTDISLVIPNPPSITDTQTATAVVTTAVVEIQAAQTSLDATKETGQTQLAPVTNEVIQVIHEAQVAIDNATSVVNTVNTEIQNVNTAQVNVNVATQNVDTATASVQIAQSNVDTQTVVVQVATTNLTNSQSDLTAANAAVETQTQVVAQSNTNLNDAQNNLTSTTLAVEAQIPVVATAQTNKDAAQAVVNANTSPGLVMTVYSNPGTNQSPALGGNLVYTGTDTNGINEQWGSSGPTVNSGSTTITETFAGNKLNTTIGITVDGTPVSTANNGGVYIGSIGWPSSAGVGSDPSLTLYQPTKTTTITMPTGTTSAGFSVFAKNGNTTGTVTYTDGTTETYVLQDDVNPNYPNYVHQETFVAPLGKTIATVTIPTDWDYFAIDNVSATKPNTAVVTEDFQVRWQGLWTPQETGTQYITAFADDGVKLYLDGQLVINDWYDKGGGGSTADVPTTAGVAKTFDMWYYENGGGANVALKRYTGSGWEVIPASEFSTSTATATQLATLATATQILNTETTTLNTLQAAKTNAENNVISATNTLATETSTLNAYVANQTSAQIAVETNTQVLATETSTLNTLNQTLVTAQSDLTQASQTLTQASQDLSTSQTNLNTAVVAVQPAIDNMNTLVASSNSLVIQTLQFQAQQRAAAAAAAAAAAYVPPAPVQPEPQVDTPSTPDQTPTDTTTDSNTSTDTPIDTPTDTADTTQPTDSTDQTSSDTTNTDSSSQDGSSSDNTNTPSQPSDQGSTPTDNKPSEPTPPVDPTPAPSQDKSTPQSTPGLVENNPNSLPETTPKLPDPSQLVAKVQVDKPGVENGGIEFFGTKLQPQVIGEDGKLTPPAPPPGSGLPIPPDAITSVNTFIGQPGGTTFNAPDIAVPVIMKYVCETIQRDGLEIHVDVNGDEHPVEQCTFLPTALNVIPGAGEAIQAIGAVYANLANIGNDMSPITRKKAKKVLLAVIVAGPVLRRRFGQ